jgi:FkbM family methyltransferase
MRDYSQYGEQAHILEYFSGRRGRFLDIGAYDGVTFSSTRALVELGWSGVLVEPEANVFVKLMGNCKGIDRLTMVNAALATQAGLIKFFSSNGDALSSTEESHCKKWEAAGVPFTPIYVSTVTARDLLLRLPGPYHFVNLDVEGANVELLQTLPLAEMQTDLLCVEHDNQVGLILDHARSHGLTRHILTNSTNMIVGRP